MIKTLSRIIPYYTRQNIKLWFKKVKAKNPFFIKKNWYPEETRVKPEGTPETYNFMKTVFQRDQSFSYAEFGIYKGATALNVASSFPNSEIYAFDFHETLNDFKEIASTFPNKFHFFGNTQKYNDSYNWSLIKLIEANPNNQILDYCFFDGAHTVAVDALNFFLADKLLKKGGYVDFDDYDWRIRRSSLDPKHIPEIGDQYTDEQIDSKQVKMIVDIIVKNDERYKEVVPNKIYKKISN